MHEIVANWGYHGSQASRKKDKQSSWALLWNPGLHQCKSSQIIFAFQWNSSLLQQSIAFNYTCELFSRHDWRLSFINLHDTEDHKNTVGALKRQELWIPLLTFDNCVEDYFVKMDELASLTVNKFGNSSWSFSENLLEENRFDGESNDLLYERVYKLVFQCQFELHSYPFDRQTCLILVSPVQK